MTEADYFILEAAEQHGFKEIVDEAEDAVTGYSCTPEQLIAFVTAARAQGVKDCGFTVAKSAHDKRVTELITANNTAVQKRRDIASAARNLRDAQRAYMAHRGSETLGRHVAERAEELDIVLSEIHK